MRASSLVNARHFLCLHLLLTLTAGGLIRPEKRQQSEISITVSPSQMFTGPIESTISMPTSPAVTQSSSESSLSVTTTISAPATTTPAISATAGATNGSSVFEVTIPHGQLPIQPTITPGWAVSGALLIVAGIICALVGIKKRWLHTFLTTGFLASLGTTVLILYVTDPPVSDAVQGAYVVAAGCTGLIVGGLAIIFQDLAEGLACLLAGFCFSMWLLTLRSGGLIQHGGGRIAFIILLSLAGFCLYFTRWTRTYGLIASVSFSGATAAVLGIDCFARAGLKEFWAYDWDLNDDIFPLGTITYPLTRGIRAEIAAIMVIFAAGIVSQLKLWQLVRHRRESELAGHEKNWEAEDEKTAQQLEEARARDLREWERKYGDGKIRQVPPSEDLGLGDMDGEKRMLRHSQRSISAVTTTRSRSTTGTDSGNSKFEYAVERAATPLSLAQATAAAMACSPTRNLKGAIKDSDHGVSNESSNDSGSPTIAEKEAELRESNGRRVVSSVVQISTPGSQSSSDSNSGPGPLPLEGAERRAGGEGRPGNDEESRLGHATQRRSTTIIGRLSNGSAKVFRNISKKPTNRDAEGNQRGESREGLVAATWKVRNDTDSVAVNLDDLGSVSADEDSKDDKMEESKVSSVDTQNNKDAGKQPGPTVKPAEEVTDKTLSGVQSDQPDHCQPQQEAGIPSTTQGYALMFNEPYEYNEDKEKDQPVTTDVLVLVGDSETRSSGTPKSDESSLLKDTLVQELSPIALYYRTNEWAKHLDTADSPEEPAVLQSIDGPNETDSDLPIEKPVPLDVASLQQTATSASVPRAIPKTTGFVIEYLAKQRGIHRSSPGPLLQRHPEGTYHAPDHTPKPEPVATTRASPYRSASETLNGLTSRLFTETIAEEGGVQAHQRAPAQLSGGGHQTSRAVAPEVSAFPSAVDPLGLPQTLSASRHRTPSTLIDTREALLRSKSQGLFFNGPAMDALNGTPSVQPHLIQGSTGSPPIDIDDIPLSQRRKIIRQSSLTYESKHNRSRDMLRESNRNPSPKLNHQSWNTPASTMSPQPARQAINSSSTTSDAVRQAKLANFRNSVAADLRVSSSRNALNNTATPIIAPSSSSLIQQPTTVYDPYTFGHQLGANTQPQTQTQQIHPGMDRRNSAQRTTYGHGQQQQQQQDPSTAACAALETKQRRSSGHSLIQVAQSHRAHRAHRDAMRRLQAGAKAD
ncbi:hypothetical protein QBC32DRAFT_223504 [Pseudoneurospora amorphoporcata]|uniref:TM7S3/TM198-like domain-containing protein n=1 Tax=Pseudoneurospora amorphoporcata TaxID=241081 RepID=A0AAN6SBP7_9PEZI|nr:hypothetical protein QBC32DRAFT_223504 [Pseudoneurospora amorphoporcata]